MKKIVAIILSIIMVITIFPITAFASTSVNDNANLKLRWFTSSTLTSDASGNSRTGNVQGNVQWVKEHTYNAAKFTNGDMWYTTSSNLMSAGMASSCESGGAGTTFAFKAYVNSNTSSAPFFCIFNNNYATSGYKTLFSFAPNGAIVYTNSAGTAKYANTSTITNGWHTFVIKFFSAKSMEIYCDKTKIYGETSDFYDNHTFDVPNSIKVGVNRENTAYYSGEIRDFRMYNKNIDVNTVTDNINTIADEENVTVPTTGDTSFTNQITSSAIKVSFVQPQIGGVGIENVSGRNYYRNILYCSNSFVANATKTKVNTSSTYGYIVMPSNTIVLYDGVTAPIIPIKASFDTENTETGGYSYSTFASIYLPSTPAFSLDNTWIGLNTQNCNRTIGWPSNSGSTNQLGTTDVRSGNVCQVQSFYYEIGFKNGLVMNSIPSSNPKTDIPFRFNQTVNESSTVVSSGNIYYIDITTLKNEINSAKTQAYNVASKSGIYSSSSYSNYVNKTLALLNFDINANLQTTLGCSNAVTRVNNAINTAINEYKTAYSNLKKKEIADLQFIDGSTDSIVYEEGNTPTLPDSNVPVSNNDGTHSYLGWDNTGSTVIDDVKHIQYIQTKTSAQSCMYSSNVTQVATCFKPEITTYTCLICQHSYTTQGNKLEHSMEYVDMLDGTHRGVCTTCHDLSTQVYESHSFTNYVNNNNATCTQNATETAICDKCSATHTREVENSSLGHSLVPENINPTCESKGYTKMNCVNCDYSYIVDDSYIDELGHDYVETNITNATCISNGIIEYNCSRCDSTYNEFTPVNDNHGELIFARTVSPTETEDGYDIYYCSNLCGYWEKQNIVLADKSPLFESYIDSYNLALEYVVSGFEPYTVDSVDAYTTIINNAKDTAQNAIDNRDIVSLENATKEIIEASSILRIKTLSVTIIIDDKEYNNIVDYGNVVSFSVNEMSKVTIEQNDVTKILCYTDDIVEYTAKDNAIIESYPTSIKEESKKIVVLDNNDKVIDILYGDINDIQIDAPKIPFYTFSHWNIVSNNTIKAEYTI